MKPILILTMALAASHGATAAPARGPVYEIVYADARAIDPETGLDAVRNIGISRGKIGAISADRLSGRRTIDARGLVASPGFIDLHSHAMSYETATYQAMDGVTTRLELELGVFPVKHWYDAKAGHELINYGASVSHNIVRAYLQAGADAAALKMVEDPNGVAAERLIRAPIPDKTYALLAPTLEQGLAEGAIGIGSGTQYAPGITHKEMLEVTRAAGRTHSCVFTHIRFGSLIEPNSTLESIQENIANAAIADACVHIVHINSMAMSDAPFMVDLMRQARARHIDISTEAYPWDGSVDEIRSVMFDPGWEKRWGVGPNDLQSRATGKRLTREDFDALRAGTGNDGVIMHMNTETTITKLLRDPLVLVASDTVEIDDDNSHPRSAGTFARILGHYVRETGTLTLSDAIRKMALMPAQRLEAFVPAMKHKGRLQVGADADLVLFDPDRVNSGADYGRAKRYALGFRYVMVGGTLVVDGGKLVANVYPGQPVYAASKR